MIQIKDYEVGALVETNLLNGGIQLKTAKNGNLYLSAKGLDKSGNISILKWDAAEEEYDSLINAEAWKIKASVDEYNGTKQLKASSLEAASPGEYNLEDLVPVETGFRKEMYQEILDTIESIQDMGIYSLVDALVSEHEELYKKHPAAISHHHAAIGGMLVHVHEVMNTALALFEVYKHLIDNDEKEKTRDFIVAGTILHDIGKFYEYVSDDIGLCKGFSRDGVLEGHLIIGRDMIRDTGRALGLDSVTIQELGHIILSHHEKQEWGAAISPATRAAGFVTKADQLSATLHNYLIGFEEQTEDISEERNIFGNRSVR